MYIVCAVCICGYGMQHDENLRYPMSKREILPFRLRTGSYHLVIKRGWLQNLSCSSVTFPAGDLRLES